MSADIFRDRPLFFQRGGDVRVQLVDRMHHTHNVLHRFAGAIQVLNKKSFGKFTDDDRKILEKLAAHIQMNIEHIFLCQQLAKLLEDTSKAVALIESRLL